MSIGQFRGKPVDETMTKEELLEVIEYLASEVTGLRQERNEFDSVIYAEKVRRLGIAPPTLTKQRGEEYEH